METAIFGPGAIDQAHQPDEFLDMARIEPTRDILRAVITEICRPR
jgi:acetylornithine deacetylase